MEPAILILRRLLIILVIAVFHLATSIYFVAMAFLDGMARFDTNAAPTTGQHITSAIASILTFPLVWLVDLMPGSWTRDSDWDVVLFMANSLLWGATVYFGVRWAVGKYRATHPGQATTPAAKP